MLYRLLICVIVVLTCGVTGCVTGGDPAPDEAGPELRDVDIENPRDRYAFACSEDDDCALFNLIDVCFGCPDLSLARESWELATEDQERLNAMCEDGIATCQHVDVAVCVDGECSSQSIESEG